MRIFDFRFSIADWTRSRCDVFALHRWERRAYTPSSAVFSLFPFAFCLLFAVSSSLAQTAAPDPDLQVQNVPHGTVKDYVWKTSHVYPGTEHNYRVYVPAQYDATKPACVMIFQDGLGFNAPTVFDNLIAKKQMPVTVAIGISPGVAPPAGANPGNALPRFNRSVEYDTPDDTYARFLLDEILPEVGRTLNLSRNPNDRGLCGASSGGIAAFTAAWERPDQFRRVYSVIGSFTDLAGGDTYPSKIRKYEPKPLRIYLQDNDQDQDIYSGSWPLANQEVAAALKFAGYDYRYAVGQGGHDGRPGGLIFPEAMRWLWRDYPAPIKANTSTGQPVAQILTPGADWQGVRTGAVDEYVSLASNTAGDVFFLTEGGGRAALHQIDAGEYNSAYRMSDYKDKVLYTGKENLNGLAFTPDERLIAGNIAQKTLTAFDARGSAAVFARNTAAVDMVISHQGIVYFTDATGDIWMLGKNGRKRLAYADGKGYEQAEERNLFRAAPRYPLTLTPDQSLLIVGNRHPRKALTSWRIQPDGTLTDREPFFDITTRYDYYNSPFASGVSALAVDTQGWLYVATPAGIQICDQAGRVNGILALPFERSTVNALTFGGPNHDVLYAACNSTLYRRKLRVKGALPFAEPIKPPSPRL